jgi:hypothetical protein
MTLLPILIAVLRALTGFMIASVIILFQALANAVCLMLL